MSFWSKIKASAIPGDLNDPIQQKLQPKPQTVVPPVSTTNTPPVEVDQPQVDQPLGNAIIKNKKPKSVEGPPSAEELQSAPEGQPTTELEQLFASITKQFMQTDICKKYQLENPQFLTNLGGFFHTPKGKGMAWYNWFMQAAARREIPGIEKYTTSQAIKSWLYTPQGKKEIGSLAQQLVQSRPEEFAQAVNSARIDSQYGGSSNSLNNEIGGKGSGKDRSSNTSQDDKNRKMQMAPDSIETNVDPDEVNAPDPEQLASFWTRERKNLIIAPEMSEAEKQQFGGGANSPVFKKLIQNNLVSVQDLMASLNHVRNKEGVSLYENLRDREKVIGSAIQWPFLGFSDSEKSSGDVALTNWQEYFVKHGMEGEEDENGNPVRVPVDPSVITNDTKNGNINKYMQEMLTDAIDPQSPFWKFMQDKSEEYVKAAYDYQNTATMVGDKDIDHDFTPKGKDFDTFDRLSKIGAACAFRQWRYNKVSQMKAEEEAKAKNQVHEIKIDKAGTALRRYAYLKTKIPAITKKLKEAATSPVGTYIPFGEDIKDNGQQKFIHRGSDGHLHIRHVTFNKHIPLTDKQSLKNHLEDERYAYDEPLTTFNWMKVASTIDRSSYVPSMIDMVQKTDPSALKKPVEKNDSLSPYAQSWSQENKKWLDQNPEAPDRLKVYRELRGKHIFDALSSRGISPAEVIDKINGLKTDKGNKYSSGKNASDYTSNKQWLEAILNGQPVNYSKADFETLSKGISTAAKMKGQPGATLEDIYAPYSHEYDKHCAEDLATIVAQMETAPAVFARYLMHRKRAQISRGFKDSWSPKTLFCFMSMSNPHKLFSTPVGPDGEPKSDTANHGVHMYDLTGNKYPLHETQVDPVTGKHLNDAPSISNQEQSDALTNQISKIPRSDIYKGHGAITPSSPFAPNIEDPERVRKFPGSNNTQYTRDGVDENGDPKFKEHGVEAEFGQFEQAVIDSYKGAHPEDKDLDAVSILQKMKQEKEEELENTIRSHQQRLQDLQSAMTTNKPETIEYTAKNLMYQKDRRIDSFFKENEGKPDAEEKSLELMNRIWNEEIRSSGMDAVSFSKLYIDKESTALKAEFEKSQQLLSNIKNLEPAGLTNSGPKKQGPSKNKKTDKQKRQELRSLMNLVPLKYKRRMHSPTGKPGTGMHPTFNPMDFVDKFDRTSSIASLVIKTASSIDKLAEIKDRLTRLAMPSEFVDQMIDTINNEFENQLAIISRRANVRRDNKTTNTNRRRVWSLL